LSFLQLLFGQQPYSQIRLVLMDARFGVRGAISRCINKSALVSHYLTDPLVHKRKGCCAPTDTQFYAAATCKCESHR